MNVTGAGLFAALRTSKTRIWLLIGVAAVVAIAIGIFAYREFYAERTIKGTVISREYSVLSGSAPTITLVLKEYPGKEFMFDETILKKAGAAAPDSTLLGTTVELTYDPVSKGQWTRMTDGKETVVVDMYNVTSLKVAGGT